MRILKVLFLVLFFSSCIANTVKQDPYLRHTIEKGETVYSISKKYNVTPFDIYRLNPDAKEGIKENTTLLIPKAISTASTSTNDDGAAEVTTHKVAKKETLYSLAKQYSVSVADLKEWNPDVEKNGLKIGQDLIVSKVYKPTSGVNTVEVQEVKNTSSVSTHVVKTGETLYSLSRKYNITVDELKALNPQIEDAINIGDVLKIKQQSQIQVVNNLENNFYAVKPNETLFSLTKQFNVTEEELVRLNPDLKLGVREGMLLKLPTNLVIKDSLASTKPKANLLATIDYNTKKELVLLLPFNLAKMEADSTKTSKDFIKTSKFLNLTLDFYSGALVAIDSAKTLGLPVNVKIIDVESSPKSSNIAQIISRNDFSGVDAVIGPFYNSHAESAAQYLSKYNTPVISPLSKELSKPISNLYNAVPSQLQLNEALMQYLYAKEGNIVAVISQKKNASKEYLQKNHALVKFPTADEKGAFTIDAIRTQLVKGKKNFVILDSEKAGQVMNITSSLMKLKEEFDIQLVVFEIYDTLDYEEIKMQNLIELKLLFPSVTKEAKTIEELVAVKKMVTANKLNPNYYVVKGFDVTFDTLLRICQSENFEETSQKFSTDGVENGFNYVNENGTWVNKAIYIQFYDTDYTVKTAE
ncbi:LysM peptidoglycan-binding domain-containing protein [Flavobacterium okayamense]|uniref:LysM domain-containing protein n=1 Tax=Flavobacterium okayamense TaxID=2830782 RepID=A0ABM7S9C7_9FLAO|nr:LysM peptidoglycan-binding domain-containing protein [Flavobacterium okayamense]BCY29558.1 hypothetical protein KK2020170_24260 [Flavobacterium okayamense]